MGSKRFALQGIEYAFLCAQSIIEYEAVAVAKQQPIRGQRPKTQDPGGRAGFAPKCEQFEVLSALFI
jgi:hypothetical protein